MGAEAVSAEAHLLSVVPGVDASVTVRIVRYSVIEDPSFNVYL